MVRRKPNSGTAAFQPSLFGDDDEAPAHAPGVVPMITPDPGPIDLQVTPVLELPALEEAVRAAGRFALYTVATGVGDMGAEAHGWAIATAPDRAWYLPASLEGAPALLARLLEDPSLLTLSPDIKRDTVVLSNTLCPAPCPLSTPSTSDDSRVVRRKPNTGDLRPSSFYDITLAHYLLEPEMRHSVEILAANYLGRHLPDYESIAGKGARQLRPGDLPLADLHNWAGQMAVAVWSLYQPLKTEVEMEGLDGLLTDIEFPLALVLADMEMAGVRIDVEALNRAATEMRTRMADLEKEIYALVGEEFNVGSPSKVGEILFDKLQLDPKAKKTKTGQYSTSEEVLEKVADKHPVVNKILEYRQMKKLLNTYLTALPEWIDPRTGKIHTTYNQTVTATGRLSSSDPNLQNIPIREEMGRGIRAAFIPDEGNLFLSADYSQIELRLAADMANDAVMLDAFLHDKDIHAITASKIYHEPLESVTPEQRRRAKTANFGILYGISAFGLAQRLGIPRKEAKELIEGYFATFPTIRAYMDKSVNTAREQGYVTTIKGRRRRLADIMSKNPVVRGYAERNAINAPIQGSAADIIKIAMVRIADEMRAKGLKSQMIMQVHDELNFNVVPDELPVMQELVSRQMEAAFSGRVRLSASMGTGPDWLAAH